MKHIEPTIYIIDDDKSVRTGLDRLLRSFNYNTRLFASALDFIDALPSVETNSPGCILLDLKMPGMSGLELQNKLSGHDKLLPIIFITGHGDIIASVKAMKGGAIDFLTKPFEEEVLLSAIKIALEKDKETKLIAKETNAIKERMALLTPREYQIMTFVIAGLLNKQIASELDISEKTVKVHRSRVMEKMELVSVAELVRATEKVGIKPAPSSFNPSETDT